MLAQVAKISKPIRTRCNNIVSIATLIITTYVRIKYVFFDIRFGLISLSLESSNTYLKYTNRVFTLMPSGFDFRSPVSTCMPGFNDMRIRTRKQKVGANFVPTIDSVTGLLLRLR